MAVKISRFLKPARVYGWCDRCGGAVLRTDLVQIYRQYFCRHCVNVVRFAKLTTILKCRIHAESGGVERKDGGG